jgi:hypothetical protein
MKYKRKIDKIGFRDLGTTVLHHFPKRNNKYRRGKFLLLNQDKVMEICTGKRYPGYVLRVFVYFFGLVDYGNRIPYLSQAAISKNIKITRPEVSLALKILKEDGIIFKKEPYKDFYFSEDLLMKGNEYYDD